MAGYINLVALDGTTVAINPEEVAALTPVPAILLPTGVPAGTYITSEDGARVAVAGTVPATITALTATTLNTAQRGVIDGTTGALLRGSGIVSSVRNGAGDYTVTIDGIPAPDQPLLLGIQDSTNPRFGTATFTGATTLDVLTYDDAGVPADVGAFSIAILLI